MRTKMTISLCAVLLSISMYGQTISDNSFSELWAPGIEVQAEGGVRPSNFAQAVSADFNEDGYKDVLAVYWDTDYDNVVPLFLGQADARAITPILVGGESESFELGAMASLDILKIAAKKYLVALTGGEAYTFPTDYTTGAKSVLYELDCTGANPVFTKKQDLDAVGAKLGSILFVDWNYDGKEDILVLPVNKVYLNNGDNTFAAGQAVSLPFLPTDATTGGEEGNLAYIRAFKGDVNGDGKLDIVATQAAAGGLKVILSDATHTVIDLAISKKGENQDFHWTGCAIGDLDGNGSIDIYASNTNRTATSWTYESVIYLNDGLGNFTEKVQSPVLTSTQHSEILIYDINGDGKNDIFHAGWNSRTHSWDPADNDFNTKSYVLINDGTSLFTEYYEWFGHEPCTPSIYKFGGIAVDINNDKKMDIITMGERIKIYPGLIENVVDEPTAIKPVIATNLKAYTENQSICLNNVKGLVKVYDIAGRCVASLTATTSKVTIPVAPGFYLVSANNATAKIVVK